MERFKLTQKITQIGFQNFKIVKDTSRFEERVTNYWIDIVPFRLKICDEQFYDETLILPETINILELLVNSEHLFLRKR